MSRKTVSIIVVTSLLYSLCIVHVSLGEDMRNTIRVYLPREVTIKDDNIKLGQVSIIRGAESLIAKAGEIALGRISVPGQEIIIDRLLVLSRLASNQIPASKVILSGAEKITVKRQEQIIKGGEFVERALSFLKKNPANSSACQWNPTRTPTDLVVPGTSRDIKLSPRLIVNSAKNQARVHIDVFADGKEIDSREVTFRLRYNCRRAVTLVEISRGTVIRPENVRIEKALSSYPEPADWKSPYGLIARRRLSANTVIRPAMVGQLSPAIIIKRNQSVVIRIEKPGLMVTAMGKAMHKAGAGEYIKVRNIDSKRIILAKVNEDGTVEPAF